MSDWVPCLEASLGQLRQLEPELVASGIEFELAKPPPKACCGGGCGCGSKVALMVRADDVAKVAKLLQDAWLAAVEREGTVAEGLVTLKTPASADAQAEPPCPACGFAGPLKDGACSDCGLQLE